MKVRLDKLVLERGLAASRERAQALILAGRVLVDGQKVEKAGATVAADSDLRLLGEELKYVSRGGLKLEKALEHWRIDVRGRVCVDVGASTGGFTDCLLQQGAARVLAIDTGYGQMAVRLRFDPRVRLLERTNARYLKPAEVGEPADLVVVDVSFISATLVLPAVIRAVVRGQWPVASKVGRNSRPAAGGTPALQLVVLVKPQFEAGKGKVGKGGIVRDPEVRQAAVERVRRAVEELGGRDLEVIESPILGAEGNREF
ncbi:MAG TPA: TlyA family RNA methyltransferase, partial [Terriglobales bacterium]|nr:TlyA family RNA methyltransferase [Terriglobales bacterium]